MDKERIEKTEMIFSGIPASPGIAIGQAFVDLLKMVVIPLWLPLVVVTIPTAILLYRDRRRIPPGHCQKCGYNLTGNTSGRCPECGKAK